MHARKLMVASAAAALAFGLTACPANEENGMPDEVPTELQPDEEPENENDANNANNEEDQAFGPACGDLPQEGEGSLQEMADQPVADAVQDNPMLSTLATAIEEAGLVDTLNDAEDITLFAPSDEAFEEISEEDLNALLEDQEQLEAVLTYHVVEERLSPQDLEDGTFTTMEGGEVNASGSEEDFTINEDDEEAAVTCGDVQTQNATVYIIDRVLMP